MSSKQQKRAIEKFGAKQRELKRTLSTVRGQLTQTEIKLAKSRERVERWKAEAKTSKKAASQAAATEKKLRQKLDKASSSRRPSLTSVPKEAAVPGPPEAKPSAVASVTGPDATWSVVRLRAEARARGLVGMSNKSKAQLLAALS